MVSRHGDGGGDSNDDLTGKEVCLWAENNRDREKTMLCIIIWPFLLNSDKSKKKKNKNKKNQNQIPKLVGYNPNS